MLRTRRLFVSQQQRGRVKNGGLSSMVETPRRQNSSILPRAAESVSSSAAADFLCVHDGRDLFRNGASFPSLSFGPSSPRHHFFSSGGSATASGRLGFQPNNHHHKYHLSTSSSPSSSFLASAVPYVPYEWFRHITSRSKSSSASSYYHRGAIGQVQPTEESSVYSRRGRAPHRQQSGQGVGQGVFVSRYNQSLNLTPETILEYCARYGAGSLSLKAKTNTTHVILRECPFCTKPTQDKLSNLYKLHIKLGDGAYFCHRCGNGGSWYDFKAKLSSGCGLHGQSAGQGNRGVTMMDMSSSLGPSSAAAGAAPVSDHDSSHSSKPRPPVRLSGYYASKLLEADNEVLEYLQTERGLSRSTLRHYGVGRATYQFPTSKGNYDPAECVTFPWIEKVGTGEVGAAASGIEESSDCEAEAEGSASGTTGDGKFVTTRIKVRAVAQKGWQRLDPPGGGWGLFGLHTVPDDATSVVLTEGEYDAMAVYQATGRPAVSLPNGCRSLPLDVLPLLEKFERIYLWMDQDQPGQEGAEKFAKKLGVSRCYIVQTPHGIKDANEALLKNLEAEKDEACNQDDVNASNQVVDFNKILDNASVISHDRILTFEDLRQEVLSELIEPDKYMGAPILSLPGFTKLIKGYRKGELTVLTGPTGSGKTTFLGQISIDLAEQGQNVLWGSFEIKNTRLLQKLLKQFSKDSLPEPCEEQGNKSKKNIEAYEALADRFQNLPLYFMSFHGGSNIDEVLDAMEYAVYVNDVQHIFLDNMQFMITRSSSSKGSYNPNFDKFDTQDVAIEKFRKFATEHNIHITLVVHPRKEDESQQLNISSFYGSAKATQEADTVLILQSCDNGRRRYIDVKKNRFDGTLGMSPLYFQPKTGRYSETETPIMDPRPSPSPASTPKQQPGGPVLPSPPTRSGGGTSLQSTLPQRQHAASTVGATDAQAYVAANKSVAAPSRSKPSRSNNYQEKAKKKIEEECDDLENHWREILAPQCNLDCR